MALERPLLEGESWLQMHADHVARYNFAKRYCASKRVLDVGCGPGYGAAILREAGAESVLGIDLDQETVSEACRRFGGPGLAFETGDAQALRERSDRFDTIVSFENIEHIDDPESFLRGAARILASNGCLLVSTPDKRRTIGSYVDGRSPNPYHKTEWFPDDFRALVSGFFGDVDLYFQIRTHAAIRRTEGARHVQEHLRYLWGSASLRCWRFLRRLAGAGPVAWWAVDGLAALSVADFPVLRAQEADLCGSPFALLAVCRQPRNLP